ncbi:MAG: type II toxin-antitoxin system RelE/ParE family toxin [Nanoarchaeota archaeon]|nr:type II toxin-antitoxin system RelE/ParE family toxin [Nanoarchaeota archaeon]MBU4086910.1 type II toxin-antitoxin system RelE/ParE family toxin [Nanoarchaeota archaeon]
MKYQISYEKEALKELERLEPNVSRRIVDKIDKMSENLASCDIKKLKASDYYRLRVGDYRIILIFDNNFIKILKIGHRQQIYG